MHLSLLDNILWAAGFLGHVALLLILVFRHRVRSFPAFSGYISFQILSTAVLFWDYRWGGTRGYVPLYWSFAALDFLLLLGVLAEVALHLLRPGRRWIAGSRGSIILYSAAAMVIAAAIAIWISPLRGHMLPAWEYRGNLFTSVLTCELFTAILLTSQRLHIYWRSHVMGIGAGLTLWALVCFLVDGLHAWQNASHFAVLEDARKIAWLCTLAFWIVTFWRDESNREPLPPEVRDAILLHTDRVSYDLAQVLGSPEKEIHES